MSKYTKEREAAALETYPNLNHEESNLMNADSRYHFTVGANWAEDRSNVEIKVLVDALTRVMNSDLVTTTQFNDYSEAFDNAKNVLRKYKK